MILSSFWSRRQAARGEQVEKALLGAGVCEADMGEEAQGEFHGGEEEKEEEVDAGEGAEQGDAARVGSGWRGRGQEVEAEQRPGAEHTVQRRTDEVRIDRGSRDSLESIKSLRIRRFAKINIWIVLYA